MGVWGQPDKDDSVGVEVNDPPTRKCWKWRKLIPWRYDCRDSDASMMAVNTDVSIALGEIGRTKRRDRDCSGTGFDPFREQCTNFVDPVNPTILIASVKTGSAKNDVLDKIGHNTGWTWGLVRETCKDVKGETGVVVLCADEVDFLTGAGDNGAPVFRYFSTYGTAQFRGIVFAYYDFRPSDSLARRGLFQDLEQIEWDLGRLRVMDAGPPWVRIVGPGLVLPKDRCTWTTRSRGLRPFSYEWSGVLRGSNRSITGVVKESGWLRVTVTDPLDRIASDSLHVTVGGILSCGADDPDPPLFTNAGRPG